MSGVDAGLIGNLYGPHEWGYRCPVEGGFVKDDRPYEAAAALEAASARIAELERKLRWMTEQVVEKVGEKQTAEAEAADLRKALGEADAAARNGAAMSATYYSVSAEQLCETIYKITSAALSQVTEGK